MGKTTGFIDYKRVSAKYRPVDQRLKDYKELLIPVSNDELQRQGARCMDCGIPFCHAIGCPLYNLIPEWNDAVYQEDFKEALVRLEATNSLPEITGRICPAPCESSCTLSINTAPVTIKQIELAIVEEGFRNGWITPRPPAKETGKRVAVIGSGPAGLAAAQQLRRAGHKVTVFEKDNKIGGILRYGIPDYKLEKTVIDRRVELMKAEGIRFETGVCIGDDISAKYLKKSHDVVLLTLGAGHPRDLPVKGRDLDGIHFAMDFLTMSNKYVSGELPHLPPINAKDKTILVIGGGDTGSDCVGTSNRQGAKEVYQFEIMPKPMEWKEDWNPQWPNWPSILRTSSSHEEGCNRDWSILTKEFVGKERVEEVKCCRVEWVRTENGSMSMKEVPGSEFSVKADLVLLAMGFLHVNHSSLIEELGVQLDDRGNVKCADGFRTCTEGVFTAGDTLTGASLVVRAIFQGRQAAEQINEYLS